MAIVSPHRAALAGLIFLIAAPAALAGSAGEYTPAKHRAPAIASTAPLSNAPDACASFLASAPRSYWKQFDSRRTDP